MFFIRTGKGINHNVNQQEAPPPALSVLLQCWLQLRWCLWNNKVSSCRECRRWIKKKKTPGSEGTTSPTLLIQAGGGIQWRHLRPEGAAVNETSNLSFAPSFSKPTQLEVEKNMSAINGALSIHLLPANETRGDTCVFWWNKRPRRPPSTFTAAKITARSEEGRWER